MSNTRFATAIHILTLLARQPGEWLNSDYIAGSIQVNPVIVRRELIILNEAGLVISKKGKEGGVQLAKPSSKISLAAIYHAVKNTEVLGKKNLNPNSQCPVGRQINDRLTQLFLETDYLVSNALTKKTLADFGKQFK
ncbi:MAG TPA: Rrf2 family transcriptional regulator [Flavipsychrobacter sp.]|nr:Rrf2 family transcriptional regulator [Flavipsychrobacter sp.]